jgi:hypothetical protein
MPVLFSFLSQKTPRPEKKEKTFKTEASLSGLDPLLASLRRKASRADAAILEALREQCSGFVAGEEEGEEAEEKEGGAGEGDDENIKAKKPTPRTVGASLAAAARAAASLSLRISDVGAKAAASEALVDDICRDVRALDAAKKNLTRGIAALRRLGMLSAAVDQLEAASGAGDLGEAARLLAAVNELGDHFAPHAAAVPAVRELAARAAALRASLARAALREFELWPVAEVDGASGRGQPEAPLLARLRDAGALADAAGREARAAALEAVVSKELGVYRQIFYFSPSSSPAAAAAAAAGPAATPASSASMTALERTERRFAWLRRRLRSRSELWAALPRAWRPDRALAAAFGAETARQLSAALSAQAEEAAAAAAAAGSGRSGGGSSLSAGLSSQQQEQGRVEALLLAVKASNDWEREMADAFGGPRAAGADELDFEAEGGPSVGRRGGRANDDTVSASEARARAEAAARARADAAGDGPSSSSTSAAAAAAVPFKGMITSVFEPYLSLYVAAEERALAATAAALVRQEPWTLPGAAAASSAAASAGEGGAGDGTSAAASSSSPSSGGGLVLRSAPELFAAVKRSLTRCARHVSRGPALVSLSGAFARVLRWYGCALAERIPKPALALSSAGAQAGAGGGEGGAASSGGGVFAPGGMALAGASAVVGSLVAAAATAATAASSAASSAALAPLPAPRALLRQLRPPALGAAEWLVRASDADLRRLSAVAATSEYCARVSRELAASVERTVEGENGGGRRNGGGGSGGSGEDPHAAAGGDAAAEAFDDALALALATAHLAIESRLEAALGALARSPAWGDPSLSVGDASSWASDAERGLRAAAAALAPTLRRGGCGLALPGGRRRRRQAEDNSSHWRYVCDKAVASFGPRLLDGVHRCRRLSEPGCQQLLLDVGLLKAAFLALPGAAALPAGAGGGGGGIAAGSVLAAALASSDDEDEGEDGGGGGGGGAGGGGNASAPPPPRSYAAAVARAFGPAEALLKVVGAATPALADTFAALVPEGGARELSRILELKAGLRRGDAAAVLDAFVAGAGGGSGGAAAAAAAPSPGKPVAAAAAPPVASSSSPSQQQQQKDQHSAFFPSPRRAPQQQPQQFSPSPPPAQEQQQLLPQQRSPQQPFPSPQQQQVATTPQREPYHPPPPPPQQARTPAAAAAADLAARIRARVGAVGGGNNGNGGGSRGSTHDDGGGGSSGSSSATGEAGRRMRDAAAAMRERLSLRDLPFGRNARAARQQQEEEERQRQQEQW